MAEVRPFFLLLMTMLAWGPMTLGAELYQGRIQKSYHIYAFLEGQPCSIEIKEKTPEQVAFSISIVKPDGQIYQAQYQALRNRGFRVYPAPNFDYALHGSIRVSVENSQLLENDNRYLRFESDDSVRFRDLRSRANHHGGSSSSAAYDCLAHRAGEL